MLSGCDHNVFCLSVCFKINLDFKCAAETEPKSRSKWNHKHQMAAEDQFVIHHSMVLIVDTDSMKRSAEMKEWMKTTDMVYFLPQFGAAFFTTSKNGSKHCHGQRTPTMLVTIAAKQSYFNLMSRCFWIPLFMRPSLLYFHAFPLFLTQLNNETNENNERVEPWDTTRGMSSSNGVSERGIMYRDIYFYTPQTLPLLFHNNNKTWRLSRGEF